MELRAKRKTLLDQLKLAYWGQMEEVPVSTLVYGISGAIEIVENNGRMYAKGDYAIICTDIWQQDLLRLYKVQGNKATMLHEAVTKEHGHGFYRAINPGQGIYEFVVSAEDIQELFLA